MVVELHATLSFIEVGPGMDPKAVSVPITWEVTKSKAGPLVAHSDELRLSVQSEGLRTIKEDLEQATLDVFRVLSETNTVHEFFQARGITPSVRRLRRETQMVMPLNIQLPDNPALLAQFG